MQEIANDIKSFFTNVGPSLSKTIPLVSASFTEYFMSFNEATSHSEEFETASKSLKRNKAAGIGTNNSNIVLETYDEMKDI